MRTRRSLFLSFVALLGAASLSAQATAPVGTILVAHGADEAWNRPVLDLAQSVHTGGPVEVAFLMGPAAAEHRFQDAAQKLEAAGVREIVVVPLLVSSYSGHYDQIKYLAGVADSLSPMMLHHLHMAGLEPAHVRVPIRVARALDDAPAVARVLAEHAKALAKTPTEQALFIIGHGPNSAEDYAAWMENLRPVADSVRARTGFRDVKIGLVRDDAPKGVRAEAVRRIREIITLQHELTGKPVVVVPVLIAGGSVARVKFVQDLKGLPIVYAGDPLLPSPEIARWVEGRVRETTAQQAAKASAGRSQ
jgi:sirohydrochlorin ferrochelatase